MIYSFFLSFFLFWKKGEYADVCSLGVGCWDSSDAWD